MDVEKRMNLSLDAIIKQKSSKRPTKGKIAAGKGRGKVKIANVTSQVALCLKISFLHFGLGIAATQFYACFLNLEPC